MFSKIAVAAMGVVSAVAFLEDQDQAMLEVGCKKKKTGAQKKNGSGSAQSTTPKPDSETPEDKAIKDAVAEHKNATDADKPKAWVKVAELELAKAKKSTDKKQISDAKKVYDEAVAEEKAAADKTAAEAKAAADKTAADKTAAEKATAEKDAADKAAADQAAADKAAADKAAADKAAADKGAADSTPADEDGWEAVWKKVGEEVGGSGGVGATKKKLKDSGYSKSDAKLQGPRGDSSLVAAWIIADTTNKGAKLADESSAGLRAVLKKKKLGNKVGDATSPLDIVMNFFDLPLHIVLDGKKKPLTIDQKINAVIEFINSAAPADAAAGGSSTGAAAPAPTAPTAPAPTAPAPTDPAPTDPAPTDPAPTAPAPTAPAPTAA